MTTLAVIPARYASQRFPGKPLADLCGRPLVYWAWKRACECPAIDAAIVATDDERIFNAVRKFGGEAAMTSANCASGSDRIAEVVRDRPDVELVVNIQGDEPDIDPAALRQAVIALREHPNCHVATLKTAIRDEADFLSPHIVKVVCDEAGRALYFSRSPLPNRHRSRPEHPDDIWGYKHLGLYVYRRETLLEYTSWPPSLLEMMEKLEQLRFLEHGRCITVVETFRDAIGVDTPEELERARKALEARMEQSSEFRV
ncbi:3-deoxy-manno-octulosonate cytidylyltransferase [Candidatus Sumerlaeota bacterium]|nr:3-deoxy-manno-octulosonate cytidylyltransferase [Candidatus Sumerlaeota bacterium]